MIIKAEDNIDVLSITENLIDHLVSVLLGIKKQNFSNYLNSLIILPNRETVKSLNLRLLSTSKQDACVLPKIIFIDDLENISEIFIIPSLDYYAKQGIIHSILKQFTELPSANISYLTNILSTLLTKFYTFEVDINNLQNIVPLEFSKQWEKNIQFLQDFFVKWNIYLEQTGKIDAANFRNQVIYQNIEYWKKNSCNHHIIIAGLNGFIPSFQKLIYAVKQLPKGKIILNGFIPNTFSCEETHPNYLLKQILPKDFSELIKKSTKSIKFTNSANNNHQKQREKLIAEIMSNTPFLDRKCNWQQLNLSGIEILSATDMQQESAFVAITARKYLANTNKKIAIITTDNQLSNMIRCQLLQWNITIDCPNGRPINQTNIGNFVFNILHIDLHSQNNTIFLLLMKGYGVNFGKFNNDQMSNFIHSIEYNYMRKQENYEILRNEEQQILDQYDEITKHWNNLCQGEPKELNIWIQEHLNLCEQFRDDIWSINNSEQQYNESQFSNHKSQYNNNQQDLCERIFIVDLLRRLEKQSNFFPKLSMAQYKNLIQEYFATQNIQMPINYKRLKLLNPLQAISENFDIVILCGLNEGVYPKSSEENMWFLNQQISKKLNLMDSPFLISHSAFLFASAFRTEQVFLFYSNSRGNAPVLPSRWILKLQAVMQKVNSYAPKITPDILKNWQIELYKPEKSINYKLPTPNPLLEHRPIRFSVSELEKMFINPYYIYAKKILKLEVIKDIGNLYNVADFGTWVHSILENTTKIGQYDINSILQVATNKLPQHIDNETKQLWYYNLNSFIFWILDFLQERVKQTTLISSECKMIYKFVIDNQPFEIIGKADQIDKNINGNYEIIDYKTGFSPTNKEVSQLNAPQLPLLALLFEKNNPKTKVEKLIYVSCKAQKIISIDCDDLVKKIEDKLKNTLRYFLLDNSNYFVNPMYSLQNQYNDFSHLERVHEWIENKI